MYIHNQVMTPQGNPAVSRCTITFLFALLLALLGGCVVNATGSRQPSVQPPDESRHNTISYDHYSLKIDGKRVYIWSGEFQYWRLPSPSLWKDVLQKMKAGGFNTVTIYFDWGYHSPRKGVYDFSGVRNVDHLLDIAKQVGIYVIARPGPYINAETDSGGFPGWLTTIKGRARTTAPDYTADYMQWLTRIDHILARHQLTNGTGTIIAYQIENEFYDHSPVGQHYMQALEQKARADGITVPLMGNHDATFQGGLGAVQLPGFDSYPQKFDCSHPQKWKPVSDYSKYLGARAQMQSPLFFPEFQGGAFDPWGGPGYAQCRRLTGPDFERVFYEANVALGATMQSFYMTYGGISWGWLAEPNVYTSYDYGAAINTSRQLTPKYAQQKLLGYFVHAVKPLTKTVRLAVKAPTNPALQLEARVNPDNGTQIYILRHADSTSTANDSTRLWLDLSPSATRDAPKNTSNDVRIPQQPGTTIRVDGRDSRMLLANYRFGHQDLVYSTSELMTDLVQGGRDLAVLYGRKGEDGETVLRYAVKPKVQVLSGRVSTYWDASRHELRLDYTHQGLTQVQIQTGQRRLLLLIGDNQAAERFWKLDTEQGPVLVRGPYLVRTADISTQASDTMALTGDTAKAAPVEVFAPSDVKQLVWNGQNVVTSRTPSGSLLGNLQGPEPVSLPTLDHWQYKAGAPEIQPSFDDAQWQAADHKDTNNPYWDHTLPILNGDDYGFHHGNVWYRGRFTASGQVKGIRLSAKTGTHGVFTVWLNGHYLGTDAEGSHSFDIDTTEINKGKTNVVSVLVEDMGHNEDWYEKDSYKEPRGLTGAELIGSSAAIAWKIQGNRGGETPIESVRGPLNNGGLYGERMGWSLPGYPDQAWQRTTLPTHITEPGVGWYRTTFTLNIPTDQDVPVALKISDDSSRHYRALIFINGWQMGVYINAVGPQHVFPLPTGILNPDGKNTIAIASWGTEHDGGLGKVTLIKLGNYRSALRVDLVHAPGYSPEKFK